MTSHSNLHFRSALLLCFSVLSAAMMISISRPTLAAPGIGGSACVDNTDCVAPGSNLICNYESGPDYRTCQALDVTAGVPTVTASSVATPVRQNGNQSMSVYGCLGNQSVCSAQPLTNQAFWRPLGTTIGANSTFTATMNGLRPSRTYTVTIAGSEAGVIDYAQVAAATTWPGFGFTPTDANAGCDGATGLCRRDISWTTPFAGDSTVTYGINPPNWRADSFSISYPSGIMAVDALPSGVIIAVGKELTIMRRDTNAWALLGRAGTDSFLSVSAYDEQHAWSSGTNLNLWEMADGSNWDRIATPSGLVGTDTLPAVVALSSNTYVLLSNSSTGAGTKVHYYNGSSWTMVFDDPTISCPAMTAHTANDIWLGCANGVIKYTHNALATLPWNSSTAGSSALATLATVDGTNIFAGGSNGTLQRSSNGGTSWGSLPNIPIGITAIKNLVMDNVQSLYFTHGSEVYHYDGLKTPAWTTYANAGSVIGQPLSTIFIANGGQLYIFNTNTTNVGEYAMPSGSTAYSQLGNVTVHSPQIGSLNPQTTYYYWARSVGATGIIGGGYGGSFVTPSIDTIRPTVTITPPGPVTNNCSVVITGTAADTSPGTVQSVRVLVDSNPPIAATGTTSWSVTLPCSQVTVGAHTITAYSNDGTNDSLPATVTIVYDSTAPTVTITAPSPVNTSTVAVSGTANDGQDQVARIELLVNGTGGRINVPITPGASINWSMGSVALNPGVNTIVVFATDRAGNEGSASTNVTYNVPTFTLAPEPPSTQTVPAGTSAIFNIRATAVNGYTGTVNFSATTSPASLTPVFSPDQSVSLASQTTDTVTMIVPSAAGNGSGPYTITISGTDGAITKTTQVTLTLTTTPDFTLSVNPASRTVVAGNPAIYDLVTSGSSTYVLPGGGITWSTSALPSGVTASFGAMTGTPSGGGTGTVKLTLNPSVIVPAGTSVTITATDGSVTHTVTVGLEATPPPDFTLIIAPASATTVAGSGNPGAYNVTVTSLNGFGGSVHLALSSTPSDPAIRDSFSQNDFTPSTTGDVVTLNVTADNTIQCAPVPPPPAAPTPCDYNLTITGTASATPSPITKTTSATLSVIPDTTPPVISGPSASASDHDVTITWTTNELANSRFDLYADAARTTVVGFFEVPSTYCLADCHILTYDQILPPQTTFYYTITSTDQAYPNGNAATITTDANGPLTFRTQAAPDNTAPVVTINSPAAGTDVRGVVTISGSATDDNPMSQITVALTGPSGSSNLPNTNITCSSGNTCNFSLPWNTMGGTSPNGNYTLTVTALSTTGPAFSATAVRTFSVDNDTTPPTIECLPGQTVCGPIATVNLPCSGNSCTAVITWRTNEDSTSEVEYGLAVDCAQQVQRPDGTYVSCAYTDAKRYDDVNDNPSGSLPNYIDHRVTLTNLAADSLYHYRITSCNISNLCTN